MTTLQLFQLRLLEEHRELEERCAKLRAYISSPAYIALSADDKVDLSEQHMHMGSYLRVLERRIARFPAGTNEQVGS